MHTIDRETLEHLLAGIIRAEHKTTGALTRDEYWAVVRLCQELETPAFITEYWASKAATAED